MAELAHQLHNGWTICTANELFMQESPGTNTAIQLAMAEVCTLNVFSSLMLKLILFFYLFQLLNKNWINNCSLRATMQYQWIRLLLRFHSVCNAYSKLLN